MSMCMLCKYIPVVAKLYTIEGGKDNGYRRFKPPPFLITMDSPLLKVAVLLGATCSLYIENNA